MIQGNALHELINFFGQASQSNVVKDQSIHQLNNFVSLHTQAAAMCIAQIALKSSSKQ